MKVLFLSLILAGGVFLGLAGRWSRTELVAWFVILCALQLPYGEFSVNRHLANVVLLGMAMGRGWSSEF